MTKKLTKSEAGKLGALATAEWSAAQAQLRKEKYDKVPNLCLQCNAALSYDRRKQKFCNHSCSATFNNNAKSTTVMWKCEGCGKEHTTLPYKIKKYCDNACQSILTKKDTWEKIQRGEVSDRGTIRSTLRREIGNYCSNCKRAKWRGYPIALEVHHIDGNAGNNLGSNLQLLCPNCHSITDTWKGKNRGNGRAARGLLLS